MKIINNKEYYDCKELCLYIKENTLDKKNITTRYMYPRLEKEYLNGNESVLKLNDTYYTECEFMKKNIELYNNSSKASIIKNEVLKLMPGKHPVSLIKTINTRFEVYKIPLFDSNLYYINSSLCKEALEEINLIYKKNCIPTKELINLISSNYVGITSPKTINRYIKYALDEYNLETIHSDYKYNLFSTDKATLYPELTVQGIFDFFNKNISNEVNLINMSNEEYLSLSLNDFEKSYKEFTSIEAKQIHCDTKYINQFNELKKAFENTNVKLIRINSQGTYVSIDEFNKLKDILTECVPATSYFKEFGITFYSELAKNNNIDCVVYKNIYFIKKTDIKHYKAMHEYNKKLKDTMSLYDGVKLKIETFPHKKDSDFPNVKRLILKFAKNSKTTIRMAGTIYGVYNSILDTIKSDLTSENEVENNKLFYSLLNNTQLAKRVTKTIITFMNFLRNKEKFRLMLASANIENVEKEPYTSKEFIGLLSSMISVIEDDSKISKLYRDWHLSTSFSYVFLHYCLAWRRNDLVNNLPIIDLSFVSNEISDGESFIKWLEEGNKLSHEQSRYICDFLEEETSRLRKVASKNQEFLHCIISDALMQEVATLLCINEANRQLFFMQNNRKEINRNRCFIYDYTQPKVIHSQFSTKLKLDITKILNGSFENVRMNKGFMNLVRDKAEELNLFSYSYIQMIRSHKTSPTQLSETTKIYLNKNIEKGSVLAFSTGTMGSVLYLLKQIVDDEFDTKTLNQQIEDIKELNITPYQLEKNINSINNKLAVMEKEMKEYFSNNRTTEAFLNKLLYGQSFGGIEIQTKCLIKITRDEENIIRVSPIDSNNDSPNNRCPLKRRTCIGCNYMIALRYFVYEFKNKYDCILAKLENAKSEVDKEIFTQMINELYIPLLNDLATVVGIDEIYKIVDLSKLERLASTN